MVPQVVPSRQVRGSNAAAAKGRRKGVDAAAPAAATAAPAGPADPADLLPRTDISGQITDDLLRRLGSANWKVRKYLILEKQNELKIGR